MPYQQMTAADLPNYKVCRVVLNPDAYDPGLVPDRTEPPAMDASSCPPTRRCSSTPTNKPR